MNFGQRKPQKPLPETESRRRLFNVARQMGFEETLQKLFIKYEDYLKGAKSKEEVKAIQTMGISEINSLFNIHNTVYYQSPKSGVEERLTINGELQYSNAEKNTAIEDAVKNAGFVDAGGAVNQQALIDEKKTPGTVVQGAKETNNKKE
jgi:hypothetical protein